MNFPTNGGRRGCLAAKVFRAALRTVVLLLISFRNCGEVPIVAILAAVFALLDPKNGLAEGIQKSYTVHLFHTMTEWSHVFLEGALAQIIGGVFG